MSGTGFYWETDPKAVFPAFFDDYVTRLVSVVQLLLQSYAPSIETWMKANAPWTDRTANARQSLYANVELLLDGGVLIFDHGVTYGVFLEYANQGRFAIIAPALDHFAPLIWADIQRLLS